MKRAADSGAAGKILNARRDVIERRVDLSRREIACDPCQARTEDDYLDVRHPLSGRMEELKDRIRGLDTAAAIAAAIGDAEGIGS